MPESTQKTQKSPIGLTEGAIEELERIRDQQGIPEDHGLRVGIKGGGCSGFSYLLGFDQRKEGDAVYSLGPFHILMDKSHELYLVGMEIDFVDGLNNRGFSFSNPNATETCGCGTSFNA